MHGLTLADFVQQPLNSLEPIPDLDGTMQMFQGTMTVVRVLLMIKPSDVDSD
jgi:hypothetical protein